MLKSSFVLPVATIAAGASLFAAVPAAAEEVVPSDVVSPSASASSVAVESPSEPPVPESNPALVQAPTDTPLAAAAPVEAPFVAEAPVVDVPAVVEAPVVDVPAVVEAPAAAAPVAVAVVDGADAAAVDAAAKAAYDAAVRQAVIAKWQREAAERAAAIRTAVIAKWRYEAAVRAAVIAKWQYIAAIQANMRARAAAANPFATSEAWASSWKAQSVIRCESGGNYSINTGNGYYGAWQFDYGTWLSNGGGQFAQYAHWATPAQQNYIAYRTWLARGWQPWACA